MEYESTIKLILENPANSFSESTKALLVTLVRSAELAKKKADKWDKLDEQIGRLYENDWEELSDSNSEQGDLSDIGEVAAQAFGYL